MAAYHFRICRAMLVHTMPAFAGLHQQKAGIVAAGMMFLAAYQASPTDYIPQPSFPKPVMSAFAMLADRVDEPFVASWWDYGHASWFFSMVSRPCMMAATQRLV